MTRYRCTVSDFDDWRDKARRALAHHIEPDHITWTMVDAVTDMLWQGVDVPDRGDMPASTVPADFVPFARLVSHHCDEVRWHLLYSALWRITHGETYILQLSSDPLIRQLRLLEKAVRRDAHKTKAFVRFRAYQDEDGMQHYIAWHKPDHNVLPLVADFFQRRFAVMKWMIMTPFCTVRWDGEALSYTDGVESYEHPQTDSMEDVWQAYYRATFNPARIKLNMMRKEMPVRYWHTMPETRHIAAMLQEAEQRVEDMIAFMPKE